MQRFRLAIPLALVLFLADCTTKELAVQYLSPEFTPHSVAGDVVRFTLAYNRGAAMSLPIGPYSKWPLIALSLVAVAVLLRFIWTTPPTATARRIALGLLLGGAIGNLVSRLFSAHGVVDFIDIGLGNTRFYVFNVADIGITAGVCALALTMRYAGNSEERVTPG